MRLGAGQSPSRAASLRGISHFPKDDIADVLLQAADWYNVDGLLKGALEQSLDGDKIEQVALVCHFDQDIDVRLWRCLAARHRAEDSNAGNVTLRELRLEPAKFSEDFREGDHLRKGTAASGWKEAEVARRVELDLHTNPRNPSLFQQSVIVRLANHNGVMRAQRLVQRLCGVNGERLSWGIEPCGYELYKLFVLGFLQGSAPQGLELVVVQGAFLDVLLGDVVKVGVALDRLHEPNAARNAPHVVGDVARVVWRLAPAAADGKFPTCAGHVRLVLGERTRAG